MKLYKFLIIILIVLSQDAYAKADQGGQGGDGRDENQEQNQQRSKKSDGSKNLSMLNTNNDAIYKEETSKDKKGRISEDFLELNAFYSKNDEKRRKRKKEAN